MKPVALVRAQDKSPAWSVNKPQCRGPNEAAINLTVAQAKLSYRQVNPANLTAQYFVLELLLPAKQGFALELVVKDSAGVTRRMHFASTTLVVQRTSSLVRLPLKTLPREKWFSLAVDLYAVCQNCYQYNVQAIQATTQDPLKNACWLQPKQMCVKESVQH